MGPERADLRDVEKSSPEEMVDYEVLIMGIPTWGIGKMQEDWEVFISRMEDFDLSGKKVAMFGLGDQESYPETFADALGKLYRVLLKTGCSFTGSWTPDGYSFEGSAAMEEGRFVGLVLDEENQPDLTDERLDKWLKSL